jgi:hypothetical protein
MDRPKPSLSGSVYQNWENILNRRTTFYSPQTNKAPRKRLSGSPSAKTAKTILKEIVKYIEEFASDQNYGGSKSKNAS